MAEPSQQAILQRWNQLRQEVNQLYSKITELELELSEHSLVIGAIQPLDPKRRCYRMIGGVLVERTVAEVLPAVKRNQQGIQEVIQRLAENLEHRKKELAELEGKYNIKIRSADDIQESRRKEEGSVDKIASQGVLVNESEPQ